MLQNDDGHCHLDEGNLEGHNTNDQYTVTQDNEVFMYFLIKDCATILEMKEIHINFYPAADCHSRYLATCLVTGNPRPVLSASLNIDEKDCKYSITICNILEYTELAALMISPLSDWCIEE